MSDQATESVVSDEDVLTHLTTNGSARLNEQIETGVVTPIELAKAVGVRPQMVYNYIRNGRITAHKTADTQKLVINLEDAQAFVRNRLEKEHAKAAKINAELAGAASQMA